VHLTGPGLWAVWPGGAAGKAQPHGGLPAGQVRKGWLQAVFVFLHGCGNSWTGCCCCRVKVEDLAGLHPGTCTSAQTDTHLCTHTHTHTHARTHAYTQAHTNSPRHTRTHAQGPCAPAWCSVCPLGGGRQPEARQ